MRVGLIGYGYWGINLARVISETDGMQLMCICDLVGERLHEAKKLYSCSFVSSLEDILALELEAVFIATPPSTHYAVAKAALMSNKHIFVEKPFVMKIEDAYELIELADKKRLLYMVDHIFIYSEPVRYLKSHIEQFGDIVYINARRINLGLFQYTTDVIWDLAVHDLSIIDYLIGLDIMRVSVFKKKYKNFPNEAIANIDLELKNGTVVHLNVSWLSPVKVREMMVGGTKMTAIYNDTLASPLKLYKAGIVFEKDLSKAELYKQMIKYDYGEILIPKLNSSKSLNNSVEHFKDCIIHKREPITGKRSILNVIKALEIISKV